MSGEEQEIVAIIGSRRRSSGEVEYRIRWKGFTEDGDTWQIEETVEHTLAFAEYKEKLKKNDGSNESTISVSDDEQCRQTRPGVEKIVELFKLKDSRSCTLDLGPPDFLKDDVVTSSSEIGACKEDNMPSLKLSERKLAVKPIKGNLSFSPLGPCKRRRIGDEKHDSGSVVFYYRETKNTSIAKVGECVKLFVAVTKKFDLECSPRMLIGRASHADLYEKNKSKFVKPNMKMRIRLTRNT